MFLFVAVLYRDVPWLDLVVSLNWEDSLEILMSQHSVAMPELWPAAWFLEAIDFELPESLPT